MKNSQKLFEILKTQISTEEILTKFVIIIGDCESLEVGISKEDRQKIVENVSIIYHFCATIRFDEVNEF